MARVRGKCLQMGMIVAFGAFLIANAVPDNVAQSPYIEPQLTAGASKLPIIDYRTATPKVTDPVPEIITVAELEAPAIEIEEAAGPEEAPQEAAGQDEAQNPDEIDLLYRVVQAEGFTMGVEGMRYITDAILNLARSRGCSIYSVLTSGAYTVVNNGTIWRQSIYPETIEAVNAELGGQLDYEIKYFRTNYFHGFGTPCFAYGNVYFSS